MDAIAILTNLGIVLLAGIFCTYLASRLKIPNVLFLIIAGVLLGLIKKEGIPVIQFPLIFLASAALLALIMIVFDSTSRFKFKDFGNLSFSAIKLTGILIVLFLAALAAYANFAFGISSWFLSFLFASIMIGTDPSAVLVMFQDQKKLIPEFLKVESVINTPLTVLLPFMVIDFASSIASGIGFSAIDQIVPFLRQIVTGIGAGILIAIIAFRVMGKVYSKALSPISLLTSALVTYVLAEGLGGSGVLAVTALGLFFGNVYVKEKETLKTFGKFLSNTFEILVFVLLGLNLTLPNELLFYARVLVIFVVYMLLRYAGVMFVFRKSGLSFKEKLFISLNSSKGVATAVVIFMLLTRAIAGIDLILDLSLIFIVYSIILSTILSRCSGSMLAGSSSVEKGVKKLAAVVGTAKSPAAKKKNNMKKWATLLSTKHVFSKNGHH